jgi:formate hydrogenlyase subunit 6/NADH:ubiquinone oxidoreductase subunit I
MKPFALLSDLLHAVFSYASTEQYPLERHATPERLRGMLHYTPEGCTGCRLCVLDCPADALELITVSKAEKRFVVKYQVDRCTFCGQCVQNCRFNCLELNPNEWELAALNKAPFTVYYGRQADLNVALGRAAQTVAGQPD